MLYMGKKSKKTNKNGCVLWVNDQDRHGQKRCILVKIAAANELMYLAHYILHFHQSESFVCS